MFCAKINAECPHRVFKDSSYVFVLMPFKDSESIFDCIKQAVETLPIKKFTCDRADVKYTSSDIWCQKICRAIRRAKYLIVDTTGLNANVFYEFGFAHALGQTRNIIITQKIEDLPFDVKGYSAIVYTEKNFPKLRSDLQKALTDLESEGLKETQVRQSSEKIIEDLKAQIRTEEARSDKFKKEARESEKEIETLKQQIAEIKAIEQNPEAETRKLIAEKEQEIENLQLQLSQVDKQKKEEVNFLQKRLEEEQQLRLQLEQELIKFNQTGESEKLTKTTSKVKKKDWQTQIINKAKKLTEEKNLEEAVAVFTQIIEKTPDYKAGYLYRALCLDELKDYEGAISDYTRAIELDPSDAITFYNRGNAYYDLKDYDRAIADFSQAIELDPKDAQAFNNRGIAYAEINDYDRAIADYSQALALDPKLAQAFNNRGSVYFDLKEYDRAIADIRQAITLDPKVVFAHLNLAEILIRTGKLVAAEKTTRSAIKFAESTKDQAISKYLLAIALKIQGKNTAEIDSDLEQFFAKEFEIDWSFDGFENWLEKADISKPIKDYIREKTEMLKKHKK